MERRTTMADVARHVGLSKAAVSLVLNNHPSSRVSSQTSARVRAAATELGYRPNLIARSLSTHQSDVLGFVSELTTTDRFGGALVRGALGEAKRQGKVLFITETGEQPDAVVEAVDLLVDHQVDGLIYASTRAGEVPLPARAGSVPLVLLNALAAHPATVVLPDELAGGRQIVDLLLDAGHVDEVVVLGCSTDLPVDDELSVMVQRRMAGIAASLATHGVVPVQQVSFEPWELDTGYAAMRRVLATGVRPTGVICLNDRIAFGAYRALGQAGLRIPDDVSVVSFDDDAIAVFLDPMLSTAAFPYEEMGALAVRLLLEGSGPGEHLVPMPIRLRGSVRSD